MKLIVNHKQLNDKLNNIDVEVKETKPFNIIILNTPNGIVKIKTEKTFEQWKIDNQLKKKNEKKNHTKSKSRKKNK